MTRNWYSPGASVTPGTEVGFRNVKVVRLSSGCAFAPPATHTASRAAAHVTRTTGRIDMVSSYAPTAMAQRPYHGERESIGTARAVDRAADAGAPSATWNCPRRLRTDPRRPAHVHGV